MLQSTAPAIATRKVDLIAVAIVLHKNIKAKLSILSFAQSPKTFPSSLSDMMSERTKFSIRDECVCTHVP